MRIWLITGGARSGKSHYAVHRATEMGGGDVSFLATARSFDAEMERRIQRHREERPPTWETLEEPDHPERALARAKHPVVVLDCLTLLLSNVLLGAEGETEMLEAGRGAVSTLLDAAARRSGELLVITNEVGMGIVPATPLGRWFRDAQGEANRRIAESADGVVLLVSGIPLVLAGEEPSPG